MSVLLKHIHEPPEPIPGLAPALQHVLNHALAKDRRDRFQSPIKFASAFQTAIENRSHADTLVNVKPVTPKPQAKFTPGKKWRSALIAGMMALSVGAFLWARNFSIQSLPAASETSTLFPTTEVPIQITSIQLGSTGILRFQDGRAIADQAILIAQAMPLPPTRTQYEVWLVGGEDRQRLGILSLDDRGKGELTYKDADGVNLIGLYEKVEITIESDLNPDTSGPVAYTSTMPKEGGIHIRQLLSSSTTEEGGLIHGLDSTIKKINQYAHEMKTKYTNADEAGARQLAESIMNMLVGDQSPDYQDWDDDGQLMDPFDGYGLLLNGGNLGYIQSVFSEADFAANTPGVTQKMIVNGEDVKTCVQSLAQWAPQLREAVLAILTSPAGSDLTQLMLDSVTLADLMLNGNDLDGNQVIDPVIGECGVLTTYKSAYFMADMHLLPVGIFTPTVTADGTAVTPSIPATLPRITVTRTKASGGSLQNTSIPQPPPPAVKTPKPKNTDKPPNENQPTKKPKNNP